MKSKRLSLSIIMMFSFATLNADSNTLDKAKILEIISGKKEPVNIEIMQKRNQEIKRVVRKNDTESMPISAKKEETITHWGNLGDLPPSSELLKNRYNKISHKKTRGMVYTNAVPNRNGSEDNHGITRGVNKNKYSEIVFY